MPVEVRMPQLGESTYEGTIGRWLKRPGDRVERFEPLVEIITDKVNVEMPSPIEGVLREILAQEGQTLPVGTPIALMDVPAGQEAAAAAAAAQAAGQAPGPSPGQAPAPTPTAATPGVAPAPAAPGGPAPAAPSAPAAPPGAPAAAEAREAVGERPRLSPLVRRLAEEHGVPLTEVTRLQGSGAGGRVTKEDLLRYIEARRAAPAPAPAAPAAVPGEPPPGVPAPVRPPVAGPQDRLIRLSPLRRTIAQRMAQSKREIPHAYGVIEVDVTELVRWREAHKAAWRERHGTNLTYTAFFVRAAADALRAFPVVNSVWTDEGILQRGHVHIGLGIAVEDGLVVAVIHDADQKSLAGLAAEIEAVGRRAREGTLTLEDVQGATFTVTNPGVFGSIWSMPVIVPGQAAILATDAIVKRPVVRQEAIAIRDIMHLGLSFDHRVFDGAVAMQFLNHIKARLEAFRAEGLVTDF